MKNPKQDDPFVTSTFSIRVSLLEALQDASESEDMPRSQLICRAIKEWLTRRNLATSKKSKAKIAVS
jgi:metal-responsive CopG/Arc/MetJ family transcriptional regulator